MWLLFIICIILFALVVYKTSIIPFFYWKRRGLPHRFPLPILGNFAPVIFQRKSFYLLQKDIYNDFQNERYNGFYQLQTPTIYIRDIELIKQIGVKYFDHFTDHSIIIGDNVSESFFLRNLFSIQGQEWKELRTFLSPAFTSSKMKNMFELIADCARRVTNYYDEELQSNQMDVELKDIFTRYANDVIASSAFGLECDSLKDKTNPFYTSGSDCINFSSTRGLKIMLARFAPAIFTYLNLRIFPIEAMDFFIHTIKQSIAHRERNNIVRPDVLHLLLEARKGKLRQEQETKDQGFAVVEESDVGSVVGNVGETLTDVDIAAQCFLFFFASFDNAANLLNFTVTELAINPDIQDKLYKEIHHAGTGEPISYDMIIGMKYLDMVVTESLRKWPPVPSLDRNCNKDFVIEPVKSSESRVTIKRGDVLAFPILGIQRDPQYFPDPERYDPERFSDENKHKIVPGSYLPFGLGPRACIGSRFALLEAKVLIVHLLQKFEFVVIDKTSVPITLTTKTVKVAPDNDFWVGLKRRIN